MNPNGNNCNEICQLNHVRVLPNNSLTVPLYLQTIRENAFVMNREVHDLWVAEYITNRK